MLQNERENNSIRPAEEIQFLVRKYPSSRITIPNIESEHFDATVYKYIQTLEYSRQISSIHHQSARIEPQESNFEESFLTGLYTNVTIIKSYLPSITAENAINGFIYHCQKTAENFSKNHNTNLKAFHATIRNPNVYLPNTFETTLSHVTTNSFITPETIGNIMFFLKPIRLELEIKKREAIFNHYRKDPTTLGLSDTELGYIISSNIRRGIDYKIEQLKRIKTKRQEDREKRKSEEVINQKSSTRILEKIPNTQPNNRKNLSTLIISLARTTPKIESMSQTLKIRLNQLTRQRQRLKEEN